MIRELSVNENMIIDFLTLSGGKASYKKLAEYVYKGYEIPKNPEIVMNSAVKRIIAKIKKYNLEAFQILHRTVSWHQLLPQMNRLLPVQVLRRIS